MYNERPNPRKTRVMAPSRLFREGDGGIEPIDDFMSKINRLNRIQKTLNILNLVIGISTLAFLLVCEIGDQGGGE